VPEALLDCPGCACEHFSQLRSWFCATGYLSADREGLAREAFSLFATTFGKTYEATELFERFAVFKVRLSARQLHCKHINEPCCGFAQANLDVVRAHNAQHSGNETSYTLGINAFSDLSAEEFRAAYLGLKDAQEHMATVKVLCLCGPRVCCCAGCHDCVVWRGVLLLIVCTCVSWLHHRLVRVLMSPHMTVFAECGAARGLGPSAGPQRLGLVGVT
jgi:hypothetical protein